jgi:hypothetical protein
VSTPNGNILTRVKSWLKKHEFFVPLVLGVITFSSLQHAALHGHWVAARLSPEGLAGALIVVAVWLYVLRSRQRFVYGLLECLAAFWALFSAAFSAAHLPKVETASMRQEWLVKALGGIYIFVRGADNIGEALKQKNIEYLRTLTTEFGGEKQLADALGTSEALVSDCLAGRKKPTLQHLRHVMRVRRR